MGNQDSKIDVSTHLLIEEDERERKKLKKVRELLDEIPEKHFLTLDDIRSISNGGSFRVLEPPLYNRVRTLDGFHENFEDRRLDDEYTIGYFCSSQFDCLARTGTKGDLWIKYNTAFSHWLDQVKTESSSHKYD
jgi:hypothetical protein